MRRVLIVVAAVVVAAAACVALISVLASRDSSQVGGSSGPGTLEPDRGAQRDGEPARPATPASPPDRPPTSGRHRAEPVTRDETALSDDQILEALQLGNVIITYEDERPPEALVSLQRDVSGAFDPSLAEAGQAVILARRPGAGIQGLAWRRRLVASGADDPQLREFAEAWLGQGRAGTGFR